MVMHPDLVALYEHAQEQKLFFVLHVSTHAGAAPISWHSPAEFLAFAQQRPDMFAEPANESGLHWKLADPALRLQQLETELLGKQALVTEFKTRMAAAGL
jgi:hypothetical protein